VDGGWLHPAAADAFRAMQAAAAAEGIHISLGSGYRSYSQQAAVKESKPHLAASAGRSIHGWGLAADVNGVGGFNTKAYRWLQENALRFGWTNPSWARAGGSKPEHWHWEFIGGPGASTGPLLNQTTT